MKVVGDALELMLDDNFKNDRSVIQKYGCWKRILPSGDEDEFMMFCKAKYLYERLLSRKGANTMSLTVFGKLVKMTFFKQRVTRVSLDLLYKRVIQAKN